MFVSRFVVFVNCVSSYVSAGVWGGYFYYFVMSVLFFLFLSLRLPYIFGFYGFVFSVFFVVFPVFFSLFLYRLFGFSVFFSSFIPEGTPPVMASFVCLAETISYLIRPFVLILRPAVNLSIGCFAGVSLSGLFLAAPFEGGWFVVLFIFLFLYEIFVTLVHWFIVCEILCFSGDH